MPWWILLSNVQKRCTASRMSSQKPLTNMPKKILVEVVYALPKEQTLLAFEVDAGIAAKEAVKQSGILEKYPDIDLEKQKIGLFGKVIKLDHSLREKDRVEIYRPLIADPKEVRKKRAAEGKALKKGSTS